MDQKTKAKTKKIARCDHCENNYTSHENHCPSCGYLKSEVITFQMIYTALFIGFTVLGIPWVMDQITLASQTNNWGKTIIVIILVMIPLFFMLVGQLYFIIAFINTMELKTNPKKLIHSNPNVRKEAIETLTDTIILSELSKTDPHPDVRIAALEKLTEPYLITDIAQNDRSPEVRIAAIHKIDSEPLLQKIALSEKDPKVKDVAISRISNQSILIDLARHDVSEDLDSPLFQRIKNPEIIQDLKQRYPERLLYKLIDELSLGTDIKYLKDTLIKVTLHKDREWIKVGILTLIDKVQQMPKNIVRMYITLSAIETVGTMNNNKMLETLYQQIIQEHQRSYNNYLEMKEDPLSQFPQDSHDLIRILYTGIDFPFKD